MIRAFLVEDKVSIRDTLVEAMEELIPLRFTGHAASEREALAWLTTHAGGWDVTLVDLFQCQGSGFGVLKACQARHASQRVVVLTSYRKDTILETCMALGADRVFDKGEEVEQLVTFCLNHHAQLQRQPGQPATPPDPSQPRQRERPP